MRHRQRGGSCGGSCGGVQRRCAASSGFVHLDECGALGELLGELGEDRCNPLARAAPCGSEVHHHKLLSRCGMDVLERFTSLESLAEALAAAQPEQNAACLSRRGKPRQRRWAQRGTARGAEAEQGEERHPNDGVYLLITNG